MPIRLWFSMGLVLAGMSLSCTPPGASLATAGDAPSLDRTPVGPIPGPEVQSHLTVNPYAHSEGGMTDGRLLFVQYNCSGCHGGHAGGGMGPSLRDSQWLYGDSDAHIFDSISQGRGKGMPAWGTKIPEDQIWKLVAYIKSLRTPMEPEKPTI